MYVLVCGGAGYIGSNMTAMLARAGHQPIVFDNLSKGHRAAVKNAQFIQGGLDDYDLLVKTLKDFNIEAVMHFAKCSPGMGEDSTHWFVSGLRMILQIILFTKHIEMRG